MNIDVTNIGPRNVNGMPMNSNNSVSNIYVNNLNSVNRLNHMHSANAIVQYNCVNAMNNGSTVNNRNFVNYMNNNNRAAYAPVHANNYRSMVNPYKKQTVVYEYTQYSPMI